MEDVLDVYHRPYDEKRPLVCLDEASKQLIGEVREPLPARPGHGRAVRLRVRPQRHGQPVHGLRAAGRAGGTSTVTEQPDARGLRRGRPRLVEDVYAEAEKVVLVMDNLNTHKPATLYEAFPPEQARRIAERLEIHHTPKHGWWLNMAEIELSVLARQCLARRIAHRTPSSVRIKLRTLYPSAHA